MKNIQDILFSRWDSNPSSPEKSHKRSRCQHSQFRTKNRYSDTVNIGILCLYEFKQGAVWARPFVCTFIRWKIVECVSNTWHGFTCITLQGRSEGFTPNPTVRTCKSLHPAKFTLALLAAAELCDVRYTGTREPVGGRPCVVTWTHRVQISSRSSWV
jgi:hypothetical protein